MCYLMICVLLDTQRCLWDQNFPMFFFTPPSSSEAIRQSSIAPLGGATRNRFFYSDFKAKRLNSGSENWIEICHLLQVRTETSIEANQLDTVYTMGWTFFFFFLLFFRTSISFLPLLTHTSQTTSSNKHTTTGLLCRELWGPLAFS